MKASDDDAPELTEEWFEKAALYKGYELVGPASADSVVAIDAKALEALLIKLKGASNDQ